MKLKRLCEVDITTPRRVIPSTPFLIPALAGFSSSRSESFAVPPNSAEPHSNLSGYLLLDN
jgi:hypothetical protein